MYYDETVSIFANIQAGQTLCNSIISSSESLLKAVGVDRKQITLKSSEMGISGSSSERVLNLVKAVNGTEYITGLGAKNYLDHDLFEDAGVDVKFMDYDVLAWPQQTPEFTP
ncbi:MAG: WbqC family protein [Amylibacter sp.]